MKLSQENYKKKKRNSVIPCANIVIDMILLKKILIQLCKFLPTIDVSQLNLTFYILEHLQAGELRNI